MDLLRNMYIFRLTYFRRLCKNKGVRNKLEAWPDVFLVQTSLKKMAELMEKENVLSKKEAENNALREQIRKLMQE